MAYIPFSSFTASAPQNTPTPHEQCKRFVFPQPGQLSAHSNSLQSKFCAAGGIVFWGEAAAFSVDALLTFFTRREQFSGVGALVDRDGYLARLCANQPDASNIEGYGFSRRRWKSPNRIPGSGT